MPIHGVMDRVEASSRLHHGEVYDGWAGKHTKILVDSRHTAYKVKKAKCSCLVAAWAIGLVRQPENSATSE